MDYNFPHLSADIELPRSSSESLPSLVQSPGPSLLPSALLSRFHLELLCRGHGFSKGAGRCIYIYIDGVVDCHEIPFDEEDNSDYDLDSGAVAEND